MVLARRLPGQIRTAWFGDDRAGAKAVLNELALDAGAGNDASRAALLELTSELRLARLPIEDVLVMPADIDDAEQAALITVHLKVGQFDGSGDFTAWIRTVAKNEALQVLRRKKQRNETSIEPVEGVWSEKMSSQLADRHRVDEAIAALDETFRLPLVLREREGLDYESIATRLGIEIGTVRSRISRARARVAQELLSMSGEAPAS